MEAIRNCLKVKKKRPTYAARNACKAPRFIQLKSQGRHSPCLFVFFVLPKIQDLEYNFEAWECQKRMGKAMFEACSL